MGLVNGRALNFLLAAMTIIAIVVVDARVEKESISVLNPKEMRSKRDGNILTFGKPDYDVFLIGSLVYPDNQTNGCSAFGQTFKAKLPRPTILLVDRGECYFALKTWYAQQAGAVAVLIADNFEEPLLSSDPPTNTDTDALFIFEVPIPSVLIEKSFGDSLKTGLKNGKDIVLKLNWRGSVPLSLLRSVKRGWN